VSENCPLKRLKRWSFKARGTKGVAASAIFVQALAMAVTKTDDPRTEIGRAGQRTASAFMGERKPRMARLDCLRLERKRASTRRECRLEARGKEAGGDLSRDAFALSVRSRHQLS